eukprot:TRINITY_DN110587_c0_g1_i1.p1 TRINITY_DN110587_c0_g1~~TRINITY_DN110587_c0_g1_i1.p1  ORF type:complete len:636 (-),score=150.22 TRINITY_DN110587_c0_g1_i1:18-1877(-)
MGACSSCNTNQDLFSSTTDRKLSLPLCVANAGGIERWNEKPELAHLVKMMRASCVAKTVKEALAEVKGFMSLGHNLWAYVYLRTLYERSADLYFSLLLAEPALLLPVVYTPTVGEVCQKFGSLPFQARGCYVSITDRGNVKAVLQEYAAAMLPIGADGAYECQCIVFSDGGRILGLGDLGTFGMGIPVGKLDLYTVCGGFDPRRTIPVIIDAGCTGPEGNSAGLVIRDSPFYTGLKKDRVLHKSEAGTMVNSAYYGKESFIGEFMTAARELFGKGCLLQFEDFNSNDAFPLLATYREDFLCYNDDIQGTAAVAVAAILGGIKIQHSDTSDLVGKARSMRFLFHGAGSANLGTALLLRDEAGVPGAQIFCTNSKGLIWKTADGKTGSFRNDEQRSVAMTGEPGCGTDLLSIIKKVKPDAIIGAVGKDPGCFNASVISAMLEVQDTKKEEERLRPIVFALSNPKSQAEITAQDCFDFSKGRCIYGSGTRFPPCKVAGLVREPGQVNNFFIFPGMSFGAVCCKASSIPESLFMAAAEAVAQSLDSKDVASESVVPNPARISEVAENVAVAVVLQCQKLGLAAEQLGTSASEVRSTLRQRQWKPVQQESLPVALGSKSEAKKA